MFGDVLVATVVVVCLIKIPINHKRRVRNILTTSLVRDFRPIFHIMALQLGLYGIYTYLVLISLIHRNIETGSPKMIASWGWGVKPLPVSYTITVTRI